MTSMSAPRPIFGGIVTDLPTVTTVASTCGDIFEVRHGLIETTPLVSLSGHEGIDLKDLSPANAMKLGRALIEHAKHALNLAAEEASN